VHCLRHSYTSHLAEDGADPLFLQHQLGHSFASTTAVYTNPQELHQTREKAQVAC
jgi:site-specific recombinase XerD